MHRIGRTGRAGATGLAHTFFSEQDSKYAADLIKILEGANQRVPQEIRDMARRSGGATSRGKRWGAAPNGRDGGGRGGYGGRGGRGGWSSSGRSGGDRYMIFFSYYLICPLYDSHHPQLLLSWESWVI